MMKKSLSGGPPGKLFPKKRDPGQETKYQDPVLVGNTPQNEGSMPTGIEGSGQCDAHHVRR